MREILFRAKRLDNGAWETGSLVIVRMGCHDEQCFIADKMTGYHTPVDPNTIGQYTGLKDKDGKKIFEGDIVSGYFTFWYDTFHRAFRGGHTYNGVGSVSIGMEASCPRAIIGNIHDNPTLLEEQYHA